jgi:hypothetical protein
MCLPVEAGLGFAEQGGVWGGELPPAEPPGDAGGATCEGDQAPELS